jgi:hypothetical protein
MQAASAFPAFLVHSMRAEVPFWRRGRRHLLSRVIPGRSSPVRNRPDGPNVTPYLQARGRRQGELQPNEKGQGKNEIIEALGRHAALKRNAAEGRRNSQ